MNTKIIKFDINKNLYDTLIAKQGDTKSRFLLFNLLDGSIPFSLENRSVRVYAIKPDGTEVFNDLIITDAAKGYCILELTTQMLAVAGTVKLELMVIEGEKKLTSNIFYMDVKKSINSEKAVVSTNEFGTLLTALASLDEYDNYKNEIKNARGGQVNLKTRLDNFGEQLDKIVQENGELVNSGIDINNLNFELKKIDNRKFLTFEKYKTTFENPNDDKLILSKIDSEVSYDISRNKLTFHQPTDSNGHQTILKTPFKFEAGSYYIRCRVEQDRSTGWYQLPRIGLYKDNNNWLMANVDKNNSKASFVFNQNGTINELGITTINRDVLIAPYNLIMSVNGFTAYIIYEKDGEYKTLSAWTQTNAFNFSGENNLNDFNVSIGVRVNPNDGDLIISSFDFGYTNGMCMGADFKPLTFEDGSVIQEDNHIYFTASLHSTEELNGSGGVNIYKINLLNYEIEFTGRIFQKYNNNIFGGASHKVFYDRNRKEWVVTISNFDFIDREITIGFTKSNLKNGIHVINTRPLVLDGKCWDNDIIFDGEKYLMTYNLSTGAVVFAESNDLINWTTKISKAMTGEGNVFATVNGKKYILRAETVNGLSILDFNLNRIGWINTNVWSKLEGFSTPSWGFLCPFDNSGTTNYYLLIFSASLWENKHYTYGNVWVYKAKESNEGIEFKNKFLNLINS